MAPNSFALDLSTKCLEAEIESADVARIEGEIVQVVRHLHDVSAYYIATGPIPGFGETKLDIFLLHEDVIHNYEITMSGDDRWFTLPLTSISHITESRSPFDKEFWALIIAIKSIPVEQGTLIIQCRVEDKDSIRAFANECRARLSTIIRGRI